MVITLPMVIITLATKTTLPMDITPQMVMTTTMDITPLKVMTQTIVTALPMVMVLPTIVMTMTTVMALHMILVLHTIAMIPTICMTLHIAMTPPTEIDSAKQSSRFRNTQTGLSPTMMITRTANLIRQRHRNSGTMLYPTTILVN